MLFSQVKSLAYFIFASIVVCQFPPGIYVIRNRQVGIDVLAADPQNLNGENVVGRPLLPSPDPLATWRIAISSGFNTIQNAKTGAFLSNDGGKVALDIKPFFWRIENQDGPFIVISAVDSGLYLSLQPGPIPNSVNMIPSDGPYSEWTFSPSS